MLSGVQLALSATSGVHDAVITAFGVQSAESGVSGVHVAGEAVSGVQSAPAKPIPNQPSPVNGGHKRTLSFLVILPSIFGNNLRIRCFSLSS